MRHVGVSFLADPCKKWLQVVCVYRARIDSNIQRDVFVKNTNGNLREKKKYKYTYITWFKIIKKKKHTISETLLGRTKGSRSEKFDKAESRDSFSFSLVAIFSGQGEKKRQASKMRRVSRARLVFCSRARDEWRSIYM